MGRGTAGTVASAPDLIRWRNALFTIRAVSAGTSGHGCGCIDMITPSCGREHERGKGTGRNADYGPRHSRRPEPAKRVAQ